MTWVLVLVAVLNTGEVVAQNEGEFDNIHDCFWAREYIIDAMGSIDGNPPNGFQAVCIKTDDNIQ